MFSPHGICLLWQPELIWLHVVSDAVIAASYFSIPFALAIVVSRRRDFQFGWIGWSFAAFIMACGLTHIFSIYTLWVPVYGIEGIVKAITAIASIVTAVILWPLIPKIIAIPSSAQLRQAYVALEEEGKQRRGAETLLQRFRETEATEMQIRQAQKMEAVGQLTGGIAHDFNNILTVITGTIEILADAVADRPELAGIAKLIDEAASRGAALTQHLLAFARKQPLQPTSVDINALIVDTVQLLKPAIGELVTIDFQPGERIYPALVDSNQLATAILNLALNARDAMPNGGQLRIETSNIELQANAIKTFDGPAAGKYVMISFSDTGHGIAAADLNKVFEPFYTTKEVGKGTGLGLSMVYGFVKQSNGHITIQSEKGFGTTILICLPPAEATAITPANIDVPGSARQVQETILVVEDDPLVRTYVLAQIKSLGYRTLSASNGPEALNVLRSKEPIDLLFTDVIMPGSINGRQLSIEALKLRPALKVLFTSGYTENAIDHDGRLDQGVQLLRKPYRRSDLANMLRTALTSGAADLVEQSV
ncbi:ATP-binding protein [Bradyrhizobium sp. S69]|uniref:ATP-binding protein n=1 Tax=Bradyrhizobium sp. S69 TaxID=1641856 RepID=UPI00131DDCE5|nr:ATP-binding protein [Bradyrhizobium sp. S69]